MQGAHGGVAGQENGLARNFRSHSRKDVELMERRGSPPERIDRLKPQNSRGLVAVITARTWRSKLKN